MSFPTFTYAQFGRSEGGRESNAAAWPKNGSGRPDGVARLISRKKGTAYRAPCTFPERRHTAVCRYEDAGYEDGGSGKETQNPETSTYMAFTPERSSTSRLRSSPG